MAQQANPAWAPFALCLHAWPRFVAISVNWLKLPNPANPLPCMRRGNPSIPPAPHLTPSTLGLSTSCNPACHPAALQKMGTTLTALQKEMQKSLAENSKDIENLLSLLKVINLPSISPSATDTAADSLQASKR